ncbi:MAG: hypothetical protein ACOC1P_00395 [Minisyncoccales bacterium]
MIYILYYNNIFNNKEIKASNLKDLASEYLTNFDTTCKTPHILYTLTKIGVAERNKNQTYQLKTL